MPKSQEPVVYGRHHQQVIEALGVLAKVQAGGFTYQAERTAPFVSAVTGIDSVAFPADAKDEHFNDFVAPLLAAQLVLRHGRYFELATQDTWAVHLGMQGYPPRKIVSSILSIAERQVSKYDISKISDQSVRRVAGAFTSNPAYTTDRFHDYFADLMAGNPNPLPFVSRLSFFMRHRKT